MEKIYYTIGEAAEFIGEKTSLVRYWTNELPQLFDNNRNSKGDRRYTVNDIETLKSIHYLVNVKGLTLDGARKAIKEDRSSVDRSAKALESLREIRRQLVEVRNSL